MNHETDEALVGILAFTTVVSTVYAYRLRKELKQWRACRNNLREAAKEIEKFQTNVKFAQIIAEEF